MQLRDSQLTLVTLANAAELAVTIAKGVVGNDVADTLNGSEVSRAELCNLAQVKFQSALSQQGGK